MRHELRPKLETKLRQDPGQDLASRAGKERVRMTRKMESPSHDRRVEEFGKEEG